MPRETIYTGISPDNGTSMYVTVEDTRSIYKLSHAVEYAHSLVVNSHHLWRVPTKRELNIPSN